MSLKRNEKITCPQCSKQQLFPVWSVVSSTDGTGKKLILEDLLNVFRCVACGYRSFIDEGVVYDDAVNQYSIQYAPWFQCGTKAFYANLSKTGTVVLDPLTAKVVERNKWDYVRHPHFVFTLREMKMYIHFRESCAERGLDEQAAAGGALPPAHFRSRNPLLDPEAKVKVSKDLKAAKKLLSEEQLVAFLHAANEQGQTHSVEMSCRALELGRTLDDLFTESVRDNRRNSGLTTALKVKRLAPDTYDITFGHHGPMIGDGGSWKVVYAKNGQVKELEKETFWIH